MRDMLLEAARGLISLLIVAGAVGMTFLVVAGMLQLIRVVTGG
jgi:hypothetical protein